MTQRPGGAPRTGGDGPVGEGPVGDGAIGDRTGGGRSRSRADLCARITAAEAALHATAMRMVPALPIPADLTLRQLQVLASLRSAPGSTGQALAELLGVSTPTMSGIIERVASKGWVEREQDPADRRRVLLRLTPAADEVLAALETPAQAVKERILDRLEDHEVADLARILARMRDVAQELVDPD